MTIIELLYDLIGWVDDLFLNLDREYCTIFGVNSYTLENDVTSEEIEELIRLQIMSRNDADILSHNAIRLSSDIAAIYSKAEKYNWSDAKLISELEAVFRKYKFSAKYIDFLIAQLKVIR